MDTRTIDRLFAGVVCLLGLYVVWNAVDYGYMRGTTPGPGFFPLWVGLGLTGLSAVNLARSLRGHERLTAEFDLPGLYQALGIVAVVIAFIVATPWLGMLVASSLLIPAIALVIRPRWDARFAAKIVTIAVVFPLACYVLFGVYLQVPLVTGAFGF